MLEVNQLSRSYRCFLAVDKVSFAIGKGEIVGLLGRNGAGKTTIMKMISGYLESNTGSVIVDGVDLDANPKEVQSHLGYLPESPPVYPEMTVADYLDFAADLKGLKTSVKRAEILRVIEATDISSKLLSPISTLSRGFKQRVGVAQAILGRPKLLILDEPTNGLDPEQTQHMRDLIKEVAKDATVILSTHIMQEVEALCSRVLMLHGGRLALDAELDALRHSNPLVLETTLDKEGIQSILAVSGVKEVEALDEENGVNKYRVKLHAEASSRELAALIAQEISEQRASLFLLQPELRDLESLFKEVNEGKFDNGENRDAA